MFHPTQRSHCGEPSIPQTRTARPGSLLHKPTDPIWDVGMQIAVDLARNCSGGQFLAGGGPCTTRTPYKVGHFLKKLGDISVFRGTWLLGRDDLHRTPFGRGAADSQPPRAAPGAGKPCRRGPPPLDTGQLASNRSFPSHPPVGGGPWTSHSGGCGSARSTPSKAPPRECHPGPQSTIGLSVEGPTPRPTGSQGDKPTGGY